jgi:large subunit ribosomal protein L30e
MDIQKSIRRALETGKADFGSRSAKAHAMKGGVKAILVSANCPKALKDEIKNNCSKSGIPCSEVGFTSLELGSICGKPFPVSALSVIDAGSSDIVDIASGKAVEAKPEEEAKTEQAAEARKEKKAKKEKTETEGTE